MSKVAARLFTFTIGVPLVIGLVYVDFFHHLPLHILLGFVSALAANEMLNIFGKNHQTQPKPLVITMSLLTTVIASVCAIIGVHSELLNYLFMGAIMLCMAYEVIASKTFESSNSRIITSAFTILYCGLFTAFIAKMTTVEHSKMILAVYLLMVFMCDSAAWLFGNLFGKNNKGFIKASPNKSIAGFCGGFAGSIAVGIAAHFIWNNIYSGSIVKVIVLGLMTAFAAIIGDLVESVFKRSSGVKDSGNLIPGRGGMLDSLDSVGFAAPVFYLSYVILF